MVMVLPKESTAQYLRKFNGQTFTIKRTMHHKGSQNTYYLEGCKTDVGTDYEFHEDWIVPISE